jgi:tight adherence protein B
MNDNFFALAMLLVFITVFVAIEGIYIWWNSTRGPEVAKLSKRLRMISAGGSGDSQAASLLKRRMGSDSPALARLLLFWPRLSSVDRLLVQSGTDWSLPNYGVYSGGMFTSGLIAMLLTGYPLPAALLAGAAMGICPTLYLIYRRYQRLKRFEMLLPEALDLIGRSLRAGHSLSGALQMAGAEMPDPAGEEFQQVFDEINFGISAQEALQNLAKRVPSTDLGFFVVAVLIQRESGGNLSELLANISAIIRERLKLFGKVQALSAEGRFSGWVLTFLPFITAFLMYLIDREFMALLWTDDTGVFFLKAGLVFMVVGGVWMSRIVRIHV